MTSFHMKTAVTVAFGALAVLSACTIPGGYRPPATTVPTGPGQSPTQIGPNPTAASITAARGPFSTATASALGASGFGGGTINYPTNAGSGRFGVVVVLPGFLNTGSVMSAYGARIASHGFVVLIANTNTVTDSPASRATQFQRALDWITMRSSVADRIDPNRQAVMGYSMGGGGALDAARQRGSLKAAVAMAPYESGTNYASVRVPIMIAACTGDSVATPQIMARPFYNSLSGPKAYFEISTGNHACPLASGNAIGTRAIVWLKRFVDGDTRYQQFLCPSPIAVTGATGWRSDGVC